MPDNQRPGTLETFLHDLVEADDQLFLHAKAATREAKEIGAQFPDVHIQKAELHTWLAWQETTGCPYGTAITASYFNHDVEIARAFVAWVNLLFEPAEQ